MAVPSDRLAAAIDGLGALACSVYVCRAQGLGVLSQRELKEALCMMASAPLDEERLDEVLLELSSASQEGLSLPGHQAITIQAFSQWMMNTYTKYLKDPSLIADSMTKIPEHILMQ